MQQENTMSTSPSALSFRRRLVHAVFTLAMSLAGACIHCNRSTAQPRADYSRETTLVIFSEHKMPDERWADLANALRRAQAKLVSETPAITGEIVVVRGDELKPGLDVASVITVFLRGDCTLEPRPRLVVQGALGWVPRSKGIIEPFVNVNCTRLVDMLGPMALGMNRSRRDTVMAEAMARVILHEWVHIATQSAHHTSHGVSQSEFSVRDLLADDAEARSRWSHRSM